MKQGIRSLIARVALSIGTLALLNIPPASAQSPANLPAHLGPTLTSKPFSVRDKFDYRVVQIFGLRGVVGAAFGSAFDHATNTPSEWGQGFTGYAQRYGSSFGSNLSRQTMEFGLESALHEDPRYFPSEQKGFKARIKNVALQTVVTRTDSGGNRFAFARMISAFGAGQLVNAWQPPSNNSVGHGIVRGVISLGGDALYNFLQEFFPFTRPRSLRHH